MLPDTIPLGRTIPTGPGSGLSQMLNAAYVAYRGASTEDLVLGFSRYILQAYGIDLRFIPRTNDQGQLAYELTSAYIVDEPKYTWFLLKWGGNRDTDS